MPFNDFILGHVKVTMNHRVIGPIIVRFFWDNKR